ncbi:NADPH-dependent aldehyde reductase 2, chloroplastic-like [Hordeum vulgare subsp. vulgare]|uniref:NADPH-dependent aldehyde reductase 2, chloroplastic-like n=1 Tax=Hordeum vulgare subsp. vulgare TaxID=112509 RepID=UPI001D1A4DDE|nr:NADPH-dependent aldehyde reductase 2, chloroplastic-like [Hordeum vulgare subsp. vulgare]
MVMARNRGGVVGFDSSTLDLRPTTANTAANVRLRDARSHHSSWGFTIGKFSVPTRAALKLQPNNATPAAARYRALADITVEDFDAMSAVNVRGMFLVCHKVANHMSADSGGRVMTLSSSIMGRLLPGYTATNGQVDAMTRILAKEVAAKVIMANVVTPGHVRMEVFLAEKDDSDFQSMEARSMGRIAQTTDVVPVVAFLSSNVTDWVNGQVIRVN